MDLLCSLPREADMRDVISLAPSHPSVWTPKHLHKLQPQYLLPLCCAGKGMCELRALAAGRSPLGHSPCQDPGRSGSRERAASRGPGGTAALGLWGEEGGRFYGRVFTWLVLPLTLNAFVGL